MISTIHAVFGYIKHSVTAQSKYRLHSPFAYRFYQEVIRNGIDFPQYHMVEKVRYDLISHSRFIKRRDLGAGAKEIPNDQRFVRVKDITRRWSVSAPKGQFLFRLAKDLQPRTILELGTAFGISTLYLASGAPASHLISIEGCLDSAHLAKNNFEKTGMKNITVLPGSFDNNLPLVWSQIDSLDLVFFDGPRRKEPTLRYFHECLQHIHPGTVFVFDDIHASAEMESAWREIKIDPRVKVSIDLFYMGVVFFKEELSKEDYKLTF